MGFSLKKLGRGIKKIAKKNKGGLTRLVKKVGPGLVLGAVTGGVGAGLIAKAASAAKTLGKKAKGIETPKSLVPVIRAAQISVKKTRSKLPGGAPMPPMIPTPSVGIMSSKPQAKRKVYDYQKATKTRMSRAAGIGKDQLAPKAKKAKRSGSKKAPSAAQLKARANFAKMAKARAAAKKKAA